MIDSALGDRFVGRYELTPADYGALIDAMRRGTWGLRTILVTVWISVLVLIIGLSSANWTQFVAAMRDLVTFNTVPPLVYGPIVGVAVLIAFLPQIIKWRALRSFRSFALANETVDVTLDETGFASSSKGRQGRMDWTAVRQVVVAPGYVFLMLSRQEGIPIPRRAFASEMEFAAVAALARRKVLAVGPM